MAIEPRLRVLPPEARPVGWYVSPGWNDHSVLTYFLGEGGNVTGVVVSPAMSERQKALRQAARTQGAQVVLDPHVMEQAFRGGNARGSIQRLPWARTSPATPSELAGHNGAELIQMLVSAIAEAGADAVISPTHYLSKGIRDPWWPVDLVLALRLRRELDRQGFRDVRIFHRLAVPAALLRDDPSQLSNMAARIRRLPIDALWLRTHPSGVAHSGPFVFKGLLQGCSALHAIGVPLVFERGGPVGVALTAFGVAGGIESAICGGESFDVNALRQLPDPSVEGFGPPIRVFVPELMSYVPKDEAYALLGNRLMNARYGCRGRCCAKSGPEGSVRDSRRHFLYRFSDQLEKLSHVPEHRRPQAIISEVNGAVRGLVQARTVAPSLGGSQERLTVLGHSLDAALAARMVGHYSLPDFDYRRQARRTREGALRPHALG